MKSGWSNFSSWIFFYSGDFPVTINMSLAWCLLVWFFIITVSPTFTGSIFSVGLEDFLVWSWCERKVLSSSLKCFDPWPCWFHKHWCCLVFSVCCLGSWLSASESSLLFSFLLAPVVWFLLPTPHSPYRQL